MNGFKKSAAAVGLTVGLIGGGAAGVIIGSPILAGAQDTTTTETAPEATTELKTELKAESTPIRERYGDHLRSTLDPLLQDGTLTQAQLDAVVEKMLDSVPPKAFRHGRRFAHGLAEAAEALGMTRKELADQLADGKTIAEVAQSANVDLDAVIDSMVDRMKIHLDERVEDGSLTRAEADERLAEITERVTQAVNDESLGDRVKAFREGAGHRD